MGERERDAEKMKKRHHTVSNDTDLKIQKI